MKTSRWFRSIFLVAPLLTMQGCAGFFSSLPAVASVISDANATLSIIEAALDTFFAIRPNSELRQEANRLLANCWTTLRIANAATQGAKHLSEDEREEAFKDFREAYDELHGFLQEHGVLKQSGLGGPNGQELKIERPLAAKYGG